MYKLIRITAHKFYLLYVEQMNMAYALYKGIWEATEKDEIELLPIPLWRFVDASRDKPERRPLSVLSLRLPRRRACAGWSV